MTRALRVGGLTVANDRPLVVIAGLCILESEALLLKVGLALREACRRAGCGFILKCSFDKANRTSLTGYRGPGPEAGLPALKRVRDRLGVPLLTDVHDPAQAQRAAEVADILQVPAFLCRQTDLLLACGRTGKVVNIKKGQFLAPSDMRHAAAKVESTGNRRIMLTERGNSFGYGNLVVDMRGLEVMKGLGHPVVFDCTHSTQLPGALGAATGGESRFAPVLARAAVAVGVAAVFFETHPDPRRALSDGPNSLALADVPALLKSLKAVDGAVKPPRSAP